MWISKKKFKQTETKYKLEALKKAEDDWNETQQWLDIVKLKKDVKKLKKAIKNGW